VKFTCGKIAAFIIFSVIAGFCITQDSRQEEHSVGTMKPGSCLFSGGVADNCILHGHNGNMSVSPGVLSDFHFDSHGLAPVRSEEYSRYGWMYVNRKGRVVISGVPSFDNWADEFSDGLVRTVVSNKYGFANRQGKIVVKPAYDWASPFSRGYAQVCNQCREKCLMPGGAVELQSLPGGCDHRVMVGGEWFKIDKKGRIVARLPP
jgi:hypothetical protein